MSENSPTRTSAPQPEADPETISRAPDSLPAIPSGLPTATGPVATGGSETADSVVPERIGEYLVVRKIGEGGMGSVYLAEDPKLGRKAAIKTMRLELAARKENRDRFVREARAAAAVEHDNIVPIWGIGEATDGTPYIAMPFLQGEMLDTRLKRERVSSVALILDVGRDVADGLAAAHAHNLVHRDIKPANVWLEGDPSAADPGKQVRRAKVLDFGLARSVDQQDTQLTATGAILGTPAFMAPEQARGEAVDHRADLWSLGVTLYRMATGRLPFRGSNAMAVLYSLASEAPPPVCELNPAVPPALGALVDQLLQKDAALRPQTAVEVADRLRQIAGDRAAPAVSPSVPVLVLPEANPDPWEGVTEPDAADAVVVRTHAPTPRPKPNLLLPAVGVVALSVLFVLLAVVVIKFQTGEGTLTVEISDPGVEARFKGGRLVLYGADGKERYTITPSERNKTVDAGKYTVRVEGADGLVLDTSEFTLKKQGEVVVRVTLAPPKAVAKRTGTLKNEDPSPDRKAAEWVLSIGGSVELKGAPSDWITKAADLPGGALTLTGVNVMDLGARVTDEELARFGACTELTTFRLWGSSVSDVGAAHLKTLTKMQVLTFGANRLTDAGLKHFKGMTALTVLHTFSPFVTNAGLAEFKEFPHLAVIHAVRTGVTCAGFEPFKGNPTLRELRLLGSRVNDADVEHLAALPALEVLELHETQLGDTGLLKLTPLKRLALLNVTKTKVTAEGVKALAKALPRCQITWDGGTTEPTEKSPDRKAAEWVLGQDGKVIVELQTGRRGVVAARGALPAGPFVLVEVEALDARVRGGDLSNLIGTSRIERITLNNTRVGDDGLELLAQLPTLQRLWLDNIPVTDRGLEHLAKLRRLSRLGLFGTTVGDAGLAHLKALPALDYLGLQRTRVTDAGLAHLKDFPALEELSLDNTAVTDAGLTHLKAIAKLRVCGLPGTRVTAEGVKALAKAVPRCKIYWDGGVVEPTEKEPDRAAAELVLDLGGKVLVSGTDQDIARAADLPKGPFRVRRLEIPKLTKPLTPAELALFKGLTHLEWLSGTGPGFDDATLLAFADSKKLALVYIPYAKITDAGLAIFKGNDTLGLLNVDGSTITDAGLDHLATCGRLDSFAVGAGLTDAGLEKLKRHRHLTVLIVGGPKVTEAGIKDFAKAVPRCQITWDGGVVEPTEKK